MEWEISWGLRRGTLPQQMKNLLGAADPSSYPSVGEYEKAVLGNTVKGSSVLTSFRLSFVILTP